MKTNPCASTSGSIRLRWLVFLPVLGVLLLILWFALPLLAAGMGHLLFVRPILVQAQVSGLLYAGMTLLSLGLFSLFGGALLSLRGKRRLLAWAVLFLALGGLCGALWLLRPERYLEQQAALVRLTRLPINLQTGQRNLPLSEDEVAVLRPRLAQPLLWQDPAQSPWFHDVTGQPLLWCSEVRSNEWRFFNRPGVDPELGVLLKPVTVNLRSQWDRARNVISKTQQELEHATALLAQESSARDKLAAALAVEQSRTDSLQKQAARDKEAALREASARIEVEANMRQLRAELAATQARALTLENCLLQTNIALATARSSLFSLGDALLRAEQARQRALLEIRQLSERADTERWAKDSALYELQQVRAQKESLAKAFQEAQARASAAQTAVATCQPVAPPLRFSTAAPGYAVPPRTIVVIPAQRCYSPFSYR
jgi:hypothetical protein